MNDFYRIYSIHDLGLKSRRMEEILLNQMIKEFSSLIDEGRPKCKSLHYFKQKYLARVTDNTTCQHIIVK